MLALTLALAVFLPPAPSAAPAEAATLPRAASAAPLPGPAGLCFQLRLPAGAPSLPWGDGGAFDLDPRYDRARLVADLQVLLRGQDDLLVHMEALRRAVLYLGSPGDGDAAARTARARQLEELLTALRGDRAEYLRQRAAGEPADPRREARLEFDLGYALGILDQQGWRAQGEPREHLARARELAPLDGAASLGAAIAVWSGLEDRFCRASLAHALDAERADGLVAVNCLETLRHPLGVESLAELRARLAEHTR
jgi:hypothetical protein